MGRSGGQLVEQATHTIDMMRYLVGEVTEVYCASTNQVLKEIDCPDFNAVTLRFENGAVGSLSTSWASDIGWSNTNTVDIFYENSWLHWTAENLTNTTKEQTETESPGGPGLDEVFIEAVRTGDASRIRSPYSDAVQSLVVSLAMNESAREGRPVSCALAS
jgi:myo-inositol 2-dehydrogenase / D-chiro-inositol 1-dehydrogenase